MDPNVSLNSEEFRRDAVQMTRVERMIGHLLADAITVIPVTAVVFGFFELANTEGHANIPVPAIASAGIAIGARTGIRIRERIDNRHSAQASKAK